MPHLVSDLVEAVRQEGMFPPADESTLDERIIAALNREQRLYLARLLLSVRESHQVAHAEVALSASVSRYRVPSRAVGAKVKLVSLVSGTDQTPLYPMPYERQVVEAGGGPGDYWFEANHIVLRQSPPAAGTLRITYFRRLGELVLEEEAGLVESFDTVTQTVTLVDVPADFDTAAADYDFIQGTAHFDTLAVEQSATLAGNVLTFAEALPDELAEGDYVALPGQAPLCQAPRELHDVLTLRTAFALLDAVGDPKAAATERRLDRAEKDALQLLAPRTDGSPKTIHNRNGPGWDRFFGGRRFIR
jgi:hypothetical protein